VDGVFLERLCTFGDPKRDPRVRVITVAYYALIASDKLSLVAGADAAEAQWFPASDVPHLAFDHKSILDYRKPTKAGLGGNRISAYDKYHRRSSHDSFRDSSGSCTSS
jgi:ADP-ribose pyrophosphatase YjhB (NUDIX family)